MTDSKGSDSPVLENKPAAQADDSGKAAKSATPAKKTRSSSASGKKKTETDKAGKDSKGEAASSRSAAKDASPKQASGKAPAKDAATQKAARPAGRSASKSKSGSDGGARKSASAKPGDSAKTGIESAASAPAASQSKISSDASPASHPSPKAQSASDQQKTPAGAADSKAERQDKSQAAGGKSPRGQRAKSSGRAAANKDAAQAKTAAPTEEPVKSEAIGAPSQESGGRASEAKPKSAPPAGRAAAKRSPKKAAAPKNAKGSSRKTEEITPPDQAENDKAVEQALLTPVEPAPAAGEERAAGAVQAEPQAQPSENIQPVVLVSINEIERLSISPEILIPAIPDQPEETPAEASPEGAAAAESEPVEEEDGAEDQALSDFPASFGDLSPEDVFDDMDAEADKDGETPGKKRRSRGRRGRGRKKAAAQAAEQTPSSDAQDDEPHEAEDEPEQEEAARTPPKRGKEAEAAESPSDAKGGRRKMFVSVLPEEQVEVVITEEGQVLEYYVEMLHQAKTKGNIYKGVIHNVDPNLQAAFVSYGAVKNGFLQIDEVHPEYYNVAHEAEKGRKYPPIQKVLKPGQEVLVQVVKEPAGTKGAFLTTYLSIPGRFLVLTPGREQIGVSRKVENEKERARLRELLEGLSPGPGLGVIVRTVSMGASKTNLQRDLQFLKRTWKEVRTRGTTEKAPCIIYQEQDLTARAIRDYLTETIGEVWVDDEQTAGEVTEIASALFPRKQSLVRLHKEDTGTSLFERFNLQRQLDQIHSREVSLPSGGRLVIDPTEALTAIDINSGRSGGKNNFEDMAYRTNMEAAKMIPLQLRLRDIGGQVVADFIEMRDKSHWREVEKTLRNGMKVDRARYDVGKIGPFGLLEIVRQRLGSSAISISTEPCPCCKGSGIRRNMEWQSQHALREILRALRVAQSQKQESITYAAEPELVLHLLNHKRRRLLEMENTYGISVQIDIKRD